MSRFRTDHPALEDAYTRKRHLPVVRDPRPSSAVCDSCWDRSACFLGVLQGGKPLTCCAFDFFEQHSHSTVEALVAYTCETSCVRRQSWEYDKVPHDRDYCENHCPVSQFLLDRGPSDYEYDPA